MILMTAFTHDLAARGAERLSGFAADLLAGLAAVPKRLPPKHFYDEAGSRLFEEITGLPEYYPTRTELQILAENAAAIARFVPAGGAIIEFGSGSSAKVRLLLRAAPEVVAYVPVDISAAFMAAEAARLRRDFPDLQVTPVAADFTQAFRLPAGLRGRARTGFFPGSTIGNFEPEDACAFLQQAARVLGAGAALIVGVDLVKDERRLHEAYNDAAGVTARFNLNLLARANRELGADFDLDAFEHRAFYDPRRCRIEMHLVSRHAQTVRVLGQAFAFAPGETIHTENSYKYTPESFAELARRGGWRTQALWTDPDRLFSVHALRADD